MNTPLTTVDFHGTTLIAQRGATPAETLVAMKPVAEGMGLSWQGQHEKLKEHPILSQGVREILMPTDGGPQAMTALPLSRLNFWLATIHPNKVPDEDTRARVIEYQMECADALFAHFFAKATRTAIPDQDGEIRRLINELRMLLRRYREKSPASRRTIYRWICSRYGTDRFADLNAEELRDAIAFVRTEIRQGRVGAAEPRAALPTGKAEAVTDKNLIKMDFYTTHEKAWRICQILAS